MKSLMAIIDRISHVAVWIGGAMLIMTAFLVFVEVIVRKVFLLSLGGADELSGYAFAIASTWAFSFALLVRAHIRIDVVYVKLPPRFRAFLDVVALTSLGLFAAVMTRYAWDTFAFTIQFSTHANTPLETPLWIPQSLWLAGIIFFMVTLALQIIRSLAALMTGRWDVVQKLAGTRSIDDDITDERDPSLSDAT